MYTKFAFRFSFSKVFSYFYDIFMHLSEKRKGESLAFLYSVLESLWPILSIISAGSVHPFLFTAMSTLLAAPIFFVLMIMRNRLSELKKKEAWLPMLGTALFLVAILHPIITVGMNHSTAGNASIVMMVEIFYSFIFFGLILRIERYSIYAFLGAGLMILGALSLLFHGNFDPQLGDIILLFAMALAPIGNFFQQRARKLVSTETLLFVRSLVGGSLALFIGHFFFPWPSFVNFIDIWPYMLMNALVIFGFQKIIWVESINRIPVAKALTLRSITPALTILLAFFVLNEHPSWWQLLGFFPMAMGAYLILNKDFLHPTSLKYTGSDS